MDELGMYRTRLDRRISDQDICYLRTFADIAQEHEMTDCEGSQPRLPERSPLAEA